MKFIYLQKIDEAAERCGLNYNSFCEEFAEILADEAQTYHNNDDDNPADGLRKWCEDLLAHGCISGMVGAFIYHHQCTDFYIKHLDNLEDWLEECGDECGAPIENRHGVRHPDFVCWAAFEEFVYKIYNEIFDDCSVYFDEFDELETIEDHSGATVYKFGAWYVAEGGMVANKVGDSRLIFDGVNLNDLRDIDVKTACDPIRHGWQLVKLINY